MHVCMIASFLRFGLIYSIHISRKPKGRLDRRPFDFVEKFLRIIPFLLLLQLFSLAPRAQFSLHALQKFPLASADWVQEG
jgi:hypothetical protein